ncbi:hypothetical protein DPMN_194741 [Dreissena polymorpha]|uniref:NACHT domain-containing protein n=1 Tax=Dreissena polymorpha TaxID=45954 RepID=A0A9D3Y5J9_DREPO|nr:hypothetical protein DPMN_194741 [Dreissena polymorpha]
MPSLSDVFAEKERTNWLKAWLAVDFAKSGLEQFVENEAKTLHTNIYNTVWSSNQAPAACVGCHTANLLKCPTQGVCNKKGGHGTCTSMHDNAAKQPRPCPANVCNKVHDEIVKQHTFNNPSWKNTSAQQWAKNPWQIAKAYFPPDGYVGKTSVQDTDFNGLISFMMNCKHFNNKFSFTIAVGKHNPPCLLTKAREICRTVRHSSQCKLTDPDLQDIFTRLTSLLSDPTCLVHDVNAREAVRKLAELEKDKLTITTEEMIHLLAAAQDTLKKVEKIADKSLEEMKMYLEQCKKDINTHLDKCKQELDHHTAKCTNTIDEHVSKTVESTYTQSREELIKGMKELYKDKLNHVTISTLNDNVDTKLRDVFMPPKISEMCIDKGEFKITDRQILKYADVFLTDDKVNRRLFLQGEAGSGKTTFLAKLTLDWCEHTSGNLDSLNKTDSKTSQLVIYDRTQFSTTSVNAEQSVMSSAPTEESHVSYPCHVEPSDTDSETNELFIDDCTELSTSSVNSEESEIFSASSAEDSDGSCNSETISRLNKSSRLFADLDVLQGYVLVFHITLRYSVKQLDVTTMIKEQIIDSIYYSQEDREKAYRLLNEIMKHERFLVLLDGLDEWTGPGDHHSLPKLVACHSQCVILITTRPWKLAVGKIRHSEIDALLQLEGINEPFELSRIILSRLVDKEELKTKCSAFQQYIWKNNLYQLLSSPMMLCAIVCSYIDGIELKGSKCEIYMLLLESLFKKANSEMCTFEQPPFPCFTETEYIQPNMENLNRLAALAFHLLFVNTKENSLVLSTRELKKFKMDGHEEKDFALKSGILSATQNRCTRRPGLSFMFIHMSIQEFLAAYHIACNTNLIDCVISVYLNRHKEAYRDISQVFIFLCGMDVSSAEKLSIMMDERHVLFENHCDTFILALIKYHSYHQLILEGNREAVANGFSHISLKLSHVYFSENNIIDVNRLWANNTTNAISLNVDINDMKRRITPTNDEPVSHMKFDLISCHKLKRLHLTGHGILIKDFTSVVTSEISVWIVLNSADSNPCTHLALVLPSIEEIRLNRLTFSFTQLCSLFKMLLTRDHTIMCTLWSCYITSGEEDAPYTSIDASINTFNKEVSMCLDVCPDDEQDLWNALHGLHIKSLSLRSVGAGNGFRVNNKESLSQLLLSLTHLEHLSIQVKYDIQRLCEAIHGLNIKSLSLSLWLSLHPWWEGPVDFPKELVSQTLSSIRQLEQLSMCVTDFPGLWEAIRGLNIKSLSLSGCAGFDIKHAESFFETLSSLKQLETLTLYLKRYISLKLPQSLQFLNVYFETLLPSKLHDLVDTLAACTHTIEIKVEFGCACDINPKNNIPMDKYIPIQQELGSRKNVLIKRFRVHEWKRKSNTDKYLAMSVRDIGGVNDEAHNDTDVKDDAYQRFFIRVRFDRNNIISIRLQVIPDSIL